MTVSLQWKTNYNAQLQKVAKPLSCFGQNSVLFDQYVFVFVFALKFRSAHRMRPVRRRCVSRCLVRGPRHEDGVRPVQVILLVRRKPLVRIHVLSTWVVGVSRHVHETASQICKRQCSIVRWQIPPGCVSFSWIVSHACQNEWKGFYVGYFVQENHGKWSSLSLWPPPLLSVANPWEWGTNCWLVVVTWGLTSVDISWATWGHGCDTPLLHQEKMRVGVWWKQGNRTTGKR